MRRATKNYTAVTGTLHEQALDSQEPLVEDLIGKEPSTAARRFQIVLSVAVYIFAALGIASHYCTSSYSDVLPFRYKQYGNIEKPCIVVIPGLDGSTNFFQDIIPELTANFNVVLYHLPLFVRPNKNNKNENAHDYTFEYLATEINSILTDLKIGTEVSLIGESFGGVIAQTFATQHPSRTKGLVLLSSLARTNLPPNIKWKADNLLPLLEYLGFFFPSLAQNIFATLHLEDVCTKSDPQFVKDLFLKEASEAHFYSVMERIKIIRNLDIVEKARSISVSTLILHGDDDHFTGESSIELHSLIPNSIIKSMSGGHLPHVTQPKEFAEIVTSFLRDIEPHTETKTV